LFLERDYLIEGQTVDERVDIICQTAERILKKEGFAKQFKENIQKGWYSLSSPIWTNFGNQRGLPISCVTGDTWINTKENGGKQAKDICLGDEVLTHKGRYRKVTNVIVTENKSDIYRLKVLNRMTNLYLTGNHPVLTNLGWINTEDLDPEIHLVAINVAPFSDGLNYVPINLLEKTNKVETVYDFTVEEDHSFSADGIVLHNCFGSHIQDTMESILSTQAEVGMMTKNGGGTSAYFGDIRPRGSKITNNGESSGSVHFMQLFENQINIISQGSTRRGQFAPYLPVDHKDILEFLSIRSEGSPLQNVSTGVTVSDEWLNSMIEGDKEKRKIWAKVIESRTNTGYPYIFFTDNVNNNTVDVYKDKNMKITHSNLCVTGDQRVVSDRGLKTAKELYLEGGNLKLFDNNKIVNASPMQLVEKNVDVYKINLSNGMSHTVTSYHKVKVRVGGKIFQKNGKRKYKLITKDVACSELKIGDKVAVQTNKGLFGQKNMQDEAFLLGLYQGDGTQTNKNISLDVWENDFDQANNNRTYNDVPKLHNCAVKEKLDFKKGFIPKWIWESNEETVWSYIKGLFCIGDTIGVNKSKGSLSRLSLLNINKKFLQEVQILMSNLGLKTSIRILKKEGKSIWRLIIDNAKKFHSVISVEYVGKEDVYCCKVDSDEHHWICNSVITHNCTEINLPDNDEESFVCDLSSMNILYYDEWKDTNAVELLVYFLDAVMTEFIEKAQHVKFMEKAVKFAQRHRALGIGWLGWHSYLQSKMIPWESMQAKYENVAIAKNIKEAAYAASEKLAKEYGEPEVLKGYGRRNTTLLAIAPTKSCTTPDTKFKDDNLNDIDYFEFTKRGGLDLHEIMSITIELDNGNVVQYKYDEEVLVERNGKKITILACDITENDVIENDITVKKVKQPEKQWFELITPVKVYTNDGIKECRRFYFNGFEPVFELIFSDNNKYKFTGNHQLKNSNNKWLKVDDINDDFISNNNLKLMQKKYIGILPTMDMEVPDVHYYVLSNGIHSHNSAFILGQVSEGIEPNRTNYYIKDLQKGKFTIKNNYLEKLLQDKGQDNDAVWQSILMNGGSVQHLSFLSDLEKDVFKTFAEISPKEILIQASARQKYIDQAQSLNLMIHPSIATKDVNALLIDAWKMGIKTLYYQISINAAQNFSRQLLECKSCSS
jgi:ribonucleoside-diphosphate reductase alpha chain